MIWTVYILECADSSLYTGITTDLARRITEHETGKGARYTHGRGPFPDCTSGTPQKQSGSLKKRNHSKDYDSR